MTPASTKRRARIGWTLTGLAGAFLLFDAVLHLLVLDPVVQAHADLGFPVEHAALLGAIELACLALHVAPRTAVLGALLWTAYLGGAVATNLRVDNPLLTHVLFPAYVALLLWGGLYLRDARVRALLPLAHNTPRAAEA